MSEFDRKPQIRFKGFTEPWEQRKLDTLTVRLDNQRIPVAESKRTEGPTPYYGANGIQDYVSGYTHDGEYVLVAEDGANDLKNYPVQHVKGRIWVNNHAHVLKANADNSTPFLKYAISSADFESVLVGGGRAKLNANIMMNLDFWMPKRKEQDLISSLFLSLDSLITLHQRKCDKLKTIKASLLKGMFPEKGANTPKIRFKGFTEPWEQRKLSDEAIEMVAGGDIDKSKLDENGEFPVLANALTNDGIVGYYASEYRIKAPAVTVTGRGDVGHAKARKIDFTPVVRLLSIRSNHDVDFLENAINTLKIVIESTGVPQLTVPQLGSYEFFFPQSTEEEKAIGTFFRNLDTLITLHQRKCEKLKNIKKSLLEQMFA